MEPLKGREDVKAFAILSYPLFIVSLIWSFIDKDMLKDGAAKYHYKQGLVLFIANIIIWIGGSIVAAIFWPLGIVVLRLNWAVWLLMSILGIINVVNGEKKEMPVIGKYAAKFKF